MTTTTLTLSQLIDICAEGFAANAAVGNFEEAEPFLERAFSSAARHDHDEEAVVGFGYLLR